MPLPTPTAALFATLACLSLLGCSNTPGPSNIEKQILLQSSTSWDGMPYRAYPNGAPELTLLKLHIPANTQLDWHTHPMPNLAYILSGELTVEAKDTGKTRTLMPGEPLAEMVNTTHRGKTGTKPVELIVFYAGTPGMALSE